MTAEIATIPGRWERFAPPGGVGFLLTMVLGALAVGECAALQPGTRVRDRRLRR